MSKALELRQNRGEAVKEMKELVEKNDKLEGDKLARWNQLDATQKELKAQIDRIETTDAVDAELAKVDRPSNPQVGEADKRTDPFTAITTRAAQIAESADYKVDFTTYLRSGSMTPLMGEMRTYSGLGDSGSTAGYQLVPIGFQKELEVRMKAIGGIRQVARIVTTATGNTLNWPTMDDTANVGHWVAEGTAVSQTNPTFGNVALTANLGSSDQVLVSVQLLQDSAFDVESFLAEAFAIRLTRLTCASCVPCASSASRSLFLPAESPSVATLPSALFVSVAQ
jgi:HK97 family phage major capsid protein